MMKKILLLFSLFYYAIAILAQVQVIMRRPRGKAEKT